jgi:hypothetical protein
LVCEKFVSTSSFPRIYDFCFRHFGEQDNSIAHRSLQNRVFYTHLVCNPILASKVQNIFETIVFRRFLLLPNFELGLRNLLFRQLQLFGLAHFDTYSFGYFSNSFRPESVLVQRDDDTA